MPAPRGRPGLRSAVDFLRVTTDAYPDLTDAPRLPQSYADELGLFSTAFVYDSALATVAAASKPSKPGKPYSAPGRRPRP